MPKLEGEVIIPEGVTTIGQAAFATSGTLDDGGGITSITIPSSVTSIGANAFAQPPATFPGDRGRTLALTRVNCYVNKSIVDAGVNMLDGNNGLTEIHVRRNDSSWTAGPGQTAGGLTLFVIKDLVGTTSSAGWNADTAWVDSAGTSEFRYTYNDSKYGRPHLEMGGSLDTRQPNQVAAQTASILQSLLLVVYFHGRYQHGTLPITALIHMLFLQLVQ
jgi:hypothetical protein